MYVPHSPHTYCANGHGGDGIFSFFTKLFPRVLSKAVIKPALKTAIAAGKTIAKKTLKTAAKEGISLAKEGVKQGLSEAAKYGIEKASEGIDKLAQKAVDKGVSEKTTHFISQKLKDTTESAAKSIAANAARKIHSGIDNISNTYRLGEPYSNHSGESSKNTDKSGKSLKRKTKTNKKQSNSSKKLKKSLINLIEES